MQKIMMIAGALLFSAAVFGQATEERKERLPRNDEKLKRELTLSDEQYASLKEVRRKYAEKQRELNQQRERDISALLTPDQKTKLKDLKAEQSKRREANHEARTVQNLSRMKTDLQLSDDQVAKLKAANDTFHSKMKSMRDDPDVDKSDFKKLKNEHQLAVKTILTEQQMKKWKEQHGKRQK